MKRITILGSTGSIGRSTLDVVSQNRDEFKVAAMTAGSNIDLFEQQIRDYRPVVVAVADSESARKLSNRIKNTQILYGEEGIKLVASFEDSDIVISAIVGSAGLLPTFAAIKAGKTIGLANKECLVMAGSILMKEAEKNNIKIIPVDSEHSAVFQCIEGYRRSDIRRIILTASGGPFLRKSRNELINVKAKDALNHPNWKMGKKITIDSATLMNKGFEVIEACWLFGMSPDKIDVLIHPQSIVHSMVEFRDGTYLAQMSMPDMRAPIAYALSYPKRLDRMIENLNLHAIGTLTFTLPDHENFPCLSYAYEAIKAGGTAPCVLNAANEVAVSAFLKDRIGFNEIPIFIKKSLDRHKIKTMESLDDALEADRWAREMTEILIKESKK